MKQHKKKHKKPEPKIFRALRVVQKPAERVTYSRYSATPYIKNLKGFGTLFSLVISHPGYLQALFMRKNFSRLKN